VALRLSNPQGTCQARLIYGEAELQGSPQARVIPAVLNLESPSSDDEQVPVGGGPIEAWPPPAYALAGGQVSYPKVRNLCAQWRRAGSSTCGFRRSPRTGCCARRGPRHDCAKPLTSFARARRISAIVESASMAKNTVYFRSAPQASNRQLLTTHCVRLAASLSLTWHQSAYE
jgi:hypothetical protein